MGRGNGPPRGEKQALGKWKEDLGSHRGSALGEKGLEMVP